MLNDSLVRCDWVVYHGTSQEIFGDSPALENAKTLNSRLDLRLGADTPTYKQVTMHTAHFGNFAAVEEVIMLAERPSMESRPHRRSF